MGKLLMPGFIITAFKSRLHTLLVDTARENARDLNLTALRLAAEDSVSFLASSAPHAKSFKTKFDLLDSALKAVSMEGLCCEFGVFEGKTINYIASKWKGRVDGFDSFEGLPEDWRGDFGAGRFAVGALPSVQSNVVLHKGWFNETIPGFASKHPEPLAFLHVDCDLYSSTQTIFEMLADRIVSGTVIQFDEFFNYPGWRQGEFKAFEEFCADRRAEFEYIGYVSADEQLAIRITSIQPARKSSPVSSEPSSLAVR